MPPRRSTRNKSTSVNATTISGNTDNSPEPSNACKCAVSSTEAATQPAKKKDEESEGNNAKKRKGNKGRGLNLQHNILLKMLELAKAVHGWPVSKYPWILSNLAKFRWVG
ncbi:hypothetical protein BDQ17DRAFT_1335131 [Cyathus striatus]|nr:hypothetical protein BDQ17DRAFT_1335131 [Cyathus striatus]